MPEGTDEPRITLEEWNSATIEQRAKWLRDHVLIRSEDFEALQRQVFGDKEGKKS